MASSGFSFECPSKESCKEWTDPNGAVHVWQREIWTKAVAIEGFGVVYGERVTHRISRPANGTSEEQIKEQQLAVKQSPTTMLVRWQTNLKQTEFGPPGSAAGPEGRAIVDETWNNEHEFDERNWFPHPTPQPMPMSSVPAPRPVATVVAASSPAATPFTASSSASASFTPPRPITKPNASSSARPDSERVHNSSRGGGHQHQHVARSPPAPPTPRAASPRRQKHHQSRPGSLSVQPTSALGRNYGNRRAAMSDVGSDIEDVLDFIEISSTSSSTDTEEWSDGEGGGGGGRIDELEVREQELRRQLRSLERTRAQRKERRR